MLGKKILFRIFWNFVIITSLFFTPWYIQIAIIFAGIIFFYFFIESIFYALFLDSIFSTPIDFLWNFQYIYTFIFIILFLSTQFIKNKVR